MPSARPGGLNNPAFARASLKTLQCGIGLIEATVGHGIHRGQRPDCFVNSIGPAKSLRGGRLMIAPSGASSSPTTGSWALPQARC
jgi:hypothetical protein